MNFDDVTAIQIPEGNVKSIAIGGVTVWEAPVVDKYTWDAVFASIDKGTYATDYAIGDTVPLDLGTEGVINMQIAAFDTDDLANGSGKAPITWVAKDLYVNEQFNEKTIMDNGDGTYQECTGVIGGWEKCALRSYLKETVKPLISKDIAYRIVTVTKNQSAYDTAGLYFKQTTEEDVWIPSKEEIQSSGVYGGLFNSNESRIKISNYSGIHNKAAQWWLRDAYNKTYVNMVLNTGNFDYYGVTNAFSICLCFCT